MCRDRALDTVFPHLVLVLTVFPNQHPGWFFFFLESSPFLNLSRGVCAGVVGTATLHIRILQGSWFSEAAITKHHRPGTFNNRNG